MKKNTIKAFTLVEMLIVIVIIGILIASLMPRMQSAQWRARDVARKNDLSQIQTSIITSQSDRGAWPGMVKNPWITADSAKTETTWWNSGLAIKEIWQNLLDAGMTNVPTDPNRSNYAFWLWSSNESSNPWEYYYLVARRNWVSNAWFALMAKTEVEWGSNWVVCQNGTNAVANWSLWSWYITWWTDLATVQLCKTVTKCPAGDSCGCRANTPDCFYKETWELRYLLLY
jgi:prepilin-type N-terminal cleavage/methylation domain-containing protein